ncbi:MAG: DUF373 family protein [Candidatus Marsarchaeota archaeon]|nr:DUF373 family protein [Candidatus Marsarchaeota archaeon]
MTERILVLATDIDNDLYRKTKIVGPVIGREENVRAATALAIADPQDSDSNTMFEAVHKYDELKSMGYKVYVATLTGAENEGFIADTELSRQIDILLDRYKIDSCVLVSDGASDTTRIVPLIKNRIKLNSVDIVRIKQAEDIENTYFTIIEKLKEPHYARIVFGVPAAIMLLFAISYYFNFGWQLPVALIGAYLIIKGLGVEEKLIASFRGFGFSIERFSFVFYTGAILFTIIALALGYQSYLFAAKSYTDPLTIASFAIEGFLLVFPISLVLYVAGRVSDLESKRLRYRAIKQGTYIGYGMISVVMLYLISAWFIGQIYFYQLLLYSFIFILLGYGISIFSAQLRKRAIKRAKMRDKHVINDVGSYIGRVIRVQPNSGTITIKTNHGSIITYDIDRVTSISDRIIIR